LNSSPLRFGILGAARINGPAILSPVKEVPEVTIRAIAARDPHRAQAVAKKHQIPVVHTSYEALLADPEIDAVYIPLPNSLHAEWATKALQAGKHVLCEKPITANADEAESLARVAEKNGLIIAEAMHSRYHAIADRVVALVRSGVIGDVKHVEAHACFVIPGSKDIRWQYEMGGGALMDLGVYAVAILRSLAGREPTAVTSVEAKLAKPQVDRWVDARLAFDGGVTGRVLTSLWGWPMLAGIAWAEGTQGTLRVINPYGPQLFNRIEIVRGKEVTKEFVPRLPATYVSQLRAFAESVRTGVLPRTGPAHFIANMKVIDAIYRQAGLLPRGMTLPRG
jgi:predicted dehydrogenase